MRAVRPTSLLGFVPAALGLVLFDCNEVKVIPAPDAGVDCRAALPVADSCQPQPAGAAGCAAALDSELCLGRTLSLDAGVYPNQCNVIVNDPTPDEDQNCDQLGACLCTEFDGGVFEWVCAPCFDEQ